MELSLLSPLSHSPLLPPLSYSYFPPSLFPSFMKIHVWCYGSNGDKSREEEEDRKGRVEIRGEKGE